MSSATDIRNLTTNLESAEAGLPPRQQPERLFLPQLDGLRFFAFLGVFVFHSLPSAAEAWHKMIGASGLSEALARFVTAGHMGVELFFVLSSFLITELLLRERERSGKINVPAFWMRRLLRIWPLYFALLTLASALTWAGLPRHNLTFDAFAFFGLFCGNWYVYFYGFPSSFASVLWTVSIEEQFYLTWPLLMRKVERLGLALAGLVLILIAVGSRWYLMSAGNTLQQIATHTLCRLDAIGAGALLSTILHGRIDGSRVAKPWGWLMLSAGLVGLVAASHHASGMQWLKLVPLASVSAALVVAATVVSLSRNAVLTSRPVTYLGKISYGLYALHTFTLTTVAALPFPRSASGRIVQWAVALSATILLASLSYRWLEKPFLRLKERFGALSRPA